MKIRRLQLKAYGPFTNKDLDLAAPVGSVNIIFGENEAGKSTALRALEGLCFGIETKTTDGHLHGYDQLRIGATLQLANGAEKTFVRRKGTKRTLQDENGADLADAEIEPFLCGIKQSGFQALFCLSYERLIEGSNSILQENGEVGKLLFDARSDLSLRSIQSILTKRADELFKGNARSNATIDRALSEFSDCARKLKKGDLAEYKEVEGALDGLQRKKGELEDERLNLRLESGRLGRLLAAIPHVRRLNRASGALQEIGEVPNLGPDFEAQYLGVTKAKAKAQIDADNAAAQVAALQQGIAAIQLDAGLLDWRTEIEKLNTQVEQISKHEQDLPQEERKAANALAEARLVLGHVRPGEEPLEANLDLNFQSGRIAALGRSKSTLDEELQGAKRTVEELESRLATARLQLKNTAETQVPPNLAGAVRAGRSAEALAASLPARVDEARALRLHCDQMSSRLGAGARTLLEFTGTPVPSKAHIQAAEDRFRELQSDIEKVTDALDDARAANLSVRAKRQALLSAGGILTEVNLQGARKSRDLQWHSLKDRVAAAKPVAASQIEEYEESVSDADSIADRMRHESDRAAILGTIESELNLSIQNCANLEAALEAANLAKEQEQELWMGRWLALSLIPESPRQMLTWLEQFDQLGTSALNLERLDRENQEASTQIEAARNTIASILGIHDAESNLTDLVNQAESLVQSSQQAVGTIKALREQVAFDGPALDRAQARLDEVTSRLETWKAEWEIETKCLRLTRVPSPEEADQATHAISEALKSLTVARIAEKRAQGMKLDISSFREGATAVVSSVAKHLEAMPSVAAIQTLYRSLKREETQEAILKTLESQLFTQTTALGLAESHLAKSNATIASLCVRAGCETETELDYLVKRFAEVSRAQDEIRQAKLDLQPLIGDKTLEQLSADVANVDEHILSAQINDLENDVSAISDQLSAVNQNIGITLSKREALDTNTEQVDTQRRAEQALSRIRVSVRPYLIYTAAESLIRAQIEEYRRANQGPILKKASEVFSVLTDGSFRELTSELDDKDQPVLIAVRTSPNGAEERLKVEALSGATRMGLYLALRLACVYHHADERESLPFVADDILLDFDDSRAHRVMEELGRLAEKTQVILLTHHKHLVAIGEQVLGNRCQVQTLAR